MKTLDWAKLAAAVVVVAGGVWRYTDWKNDLRFEGQRILYEAMADSQKAVLDSTLLVLAGIDSTATLRVDSAVVAAERARVEAAWANERAGRLGRERTALVDSILATTEHVEEVQAALEVQGASYEAELAEVRVEVVSLRAAEAQAWEAHRAEAERSSALGDALDASQAQVSLQAAIIERYERAGGHGLIVDGLIAAGGVAVGFALGGLR